MVESTLKALSDRLFFFFWKEVISAEMQRQMRGYVGGTWRRGSEMEI